MKPIRSLLLSLIAAVALSGQNSTPAPEFEVASVKPSAPSATPQFNLGVHIDGAMVNYTGLTLRDYIRTAYKVKESQISGPDWLATERFDIVAKLPAGATREQIPEMMQALLAARFKLTLHRDTKDFPVYALIVGKNGLKMKESAPDPETDDSQNKGNVDVSVSAGRGGATVSLGKGSSISYDAQRIVAKKVTMPYLADSLARFVDRPVVDMTGLKGNYDFTLDYNMDDLRALIMSSAPAGTPLPPKGAGGGDEGVSLMDSLQAAGLRLEPRKAPLEILVIDRMEKNPTEN